LHHLLSNRHIYFVPCLVIFHGSVGLWINGLVALAETVQGGEMDALVSLLREKVSALVELFRIMQSLKNFTHVLDLFFFDLTHFVGITAAHRFGGSETGAQERLMRLEHCL
jgi:hypothetical protein